MWGSVGGSKQVSRKLSPAPPRAATDTDIAAQLVRLHGISFVPIISTRASLIFRVVLCVVVPHELSSQHQRRLIMRTT